MKVLCLELCNYVQLNEVLTPTYNNMSTEAACHSCTLYYLPGSTLTHCDNIRRVGCVVYNVHEQVMPESCHYLTALHAHSHPCLVALLFIPSPYSTFFNSGLELFSSM